MKKAEREVKKEIDEDIFGFVSPINGSLAKRTEVGGNGGEQNYGNSTDPKETDDQPIRAEPGSTFCSGMSGLRGALASD